jgi:hypothetical protein
MSSADHNLASFEFPRRFFAIALFSDFASFAGNSLEIANGLLDIRHFLEHFSSIYISYGRTLLRRSCGAKVAGSSGVPQLQPYLTRKSETVECSDG